MISANKLLKILDEMKEGVEFIKFQEKIVKTKLKIIGVKIPNLRKFARRCFLNKEEIEFNNITDLYFECVVLEGFLIGFENEKENLKLKLNGYINKMDNWAVVDMVCSSLLALKNNKEMSDFNYFKSLLNNKNEFVVRFAVVGFLKFFCEKNYIDDILNVLRGVVCGKYYVDMAIAWLISEIIIKNAQKAIKLMQKVKLINNFNTFIVNKSVQKTIESNRIDDNLKIKLREMKIK